MRSKQSLLLKGHLQSLKRFPGPWGPAPAQEKMDVLCLQGKVTNRCAVSGRRVLLCWGLSPFALASFLGFTQPLVGQPDLGGMGLQQVRYSEELFKAAGSSPLLFAALPGGSCRRHAPTAPQEHSSPAHPHRDTWGGLHPPSRAGRGSAAWGAKAGAQESRKGPCTAPSPVHLHSRKWPIFRSNPTPSPHWLQVQPV